jgi:hypothetical protein
LKTDFESLGEEKEPLRNRERLVWMKSFVPASPILAEVELTGFQVTNCIVVMSFVASRSPKPALSSLMCCEQTIRTCCPSWLQGLHSTYNTFLQNASSIQIASN